MNLVKLTLATAIVASSFSATANTNPDQNTYTATLKVSAYVAAGLSVAVDNNLRFPDIVVPGAGDTTGATLDCKTGNVTYQDGGSTPNSSSNTTNSFNKNGNNGNNGDGPQVGVIIITGETDYAIQVVPGAAAPDSGSGIQSLSVLVNESGRMGDDGASLDTSLVGGTATVLLCGTIVLNDKAATSASLDIDMDVAVVVNYR